jgi:hypothetical protein
MKALTKRYQTVPFLTYNFSHRCEKGRLERSEHPENNRFVVWKRIASESVKSALLLHLNYSGTRKFMAQNAKRIATNNSLA